MVLVKIINESSVFDPAKVTINGRFLVSNLKKYDSTIMLRVSQGRNLISVSRFQDSDQEEGRLKMKYNFEADVGDYFIYIYNERIVVSLIKTESLQPDFDLQRYSGKWYQIASIPQFYERGCDRFMAEYTPLQQYLQVYNTCFDKEWKVVTTIEGFALPVNNPASLRVDFRLTENPTSYLPNYLIHETDYRSYALVGSLDGRSFYVLSRTPTISKRRYRGYLLTAKNLGYDVSKIVSNYDTLVSKEVHKN